MKKISLFVFAIVVFSVANAQKHLPKFGLKAGANFANVSDNIGSMGESKIGLYAGALWHIHLGQQFALQPEAVFSRQGVKGGNEKLHMDYINIPLQLQYMFDNGFRLETGPQLGFMINSTHKLGDTETALYKSDAFNNIDLSWGLGLNYLSSSGIGLGARYNWGVTDVYEISSARESNRVLQLGLFYMLDRAHKAKSK